MFVSTTFIKSTSLQNCKIFTFYGNFGCNFHLCKFHTFHIFFLHGGFCISPMLAEPILIELTYFHFIWGPEVRQTRLPTSSPLFSSTLTVGGAPGSHPSPLLLIFSELWLMFDLCCQSNMLFWQCSHDYVWVLPVPYNPWILNKKTISNQQNIVIYSHMKIGHKKHYLPFKKY